MSMISIAYLLASVFFILGLRQLSHPRTAAGGNLLGAVGMLLAVGATLLDRSIVRFEYILLGIALGSVAGLILAFRIQFTAMPQLVALLNGFGGAASVLVAGAVHPHPDASAALLTPANIQYSVSIVVSGLVGAVTLWGSLVAFGKLQGLVSEKPLRYRGEQAVKAVVFLASIVFGVLVVLERNAAGCYWIMTAIASVLGILLTIPIGGADMPIVIALLNSYSGIAASATGFVLNNTVLIIAGALVGASGILLTSAMCKAMNRSLPNVLFGGVGGALETAQADSVYAGKVKSTSPEEVAMLLKIARRVVFVPGYGLAVARAQSAVRQLSELLEADGIAVEFAIHPVAGRMPGHMNVLLAEENIPYDKLKEMDEANQSFPQTDMVLVLGANDVVNPLARESSGSPISGMPILNVDRARTVVVVKRSLSPGFAGIPNPLFARDNTLMLFDDAKKAMEAVIRAYKEQ